MDAFLDKYIFPYTGKYFGRALKTRDGFPIYTRNEEMFNTISHALGIFMGIGMLFFSILNHHSEMGMYGGIIFGVSMIILYLASSVYHGTSPENVKEKKIFRLFDHCSIFILVAGTCSPFILDLIDNQSVDIEWAFYGLLWIFAIGGITLLCIDMKKYKSIAVVMYVLMGAALVIRADSFIQIIGNTGMWLLLAGGVVYLIGLLFYGLGSKRKWMHSVFHVLCLVGSVLHCVCVGAFVI
ncbi:PAQR family membrane homeostasis protein TrhA [Massilicoli timonensis]|uniref:PAQR family membrane homeostasis protein TrhA n=1 Tax=Massilicoli timonensis TaxID=2015901 RepID=UPI000C827914|nr:hemolysin III family protein [Massilicoli timonensis]